MVRCDSLTRQTGENGETDRSRGSLAGALAATRVAVEVVIQAGRRAAGGVAAAVVEETPALQSLALPPGVAHAQRAVAPVPAAARGVALAVAALVPALGLAGGSRAPRLLGDLGHRRRGLAARASPARSARTAEERGELSRTTGAPVETRDGCAAGVGGSRE